MGAWTGCIFWLFKVLAAGSNKVDIEQVSLHSTLFLPSRLPPLLRAEHVRQRDNSKQSSSPKQMRLIKTEQQSSRPKQMSSSKQSSSVRDCSKRVDCKESLDYLNI